MVAVADNRYQDRIGDNQEFSWLLSDIDDYNIHSKEKKVSLLESVAREKLAKDDALRAERKAERNMRDSGLSHEDVLAEASIPETSIPETSGDSVAANAEDDAKVGDDAMGDDTEGDDTESDDEEEKGPDFLLRETARIVADVAELESNQELLERRFSQLNAETTQDRKIN
jgi:hypothetical protein